MEVNVPRDRVSGEPIPLKGFWLRDLIQRTEQTRLTGEPGFGVDMKSEQDFVIVDSGGQLSDVTNDRNVELVGVGVDIIVEDSKLVFRLNRQMTGVGDEYTHVKYIIKN